MATDLLTPVRAEAPEPATTAAPPRVPLWFEVALLLAVLGLVCCGGFGLALAVVGRYSAGLSIGVGAPVAVVLTAVATFRLLRAPGGAASGTGSHRVPSGPTATWPTVTAVVVALVGVAWNARYAGAWIFADRDPGVYAVTAKWLTRHPSLFVPYQHAWDGTTLPLVGRSAGVYSVGDGLELQFNHLSAVVFAQASAVARGDRGLVHANAVLIGLAVLAVYAVAVRLTGRPWLAVVSIAALTACLPVVYVARATFSEPITMLLVWAGVWLLLVAWERSPVVVGALAGLVLGASAMARVDSLIYLLPLPVVAVVAGLVLGRDERWRRLAAMSAAVLVGAIAPVVVGTVDVVDHAGRYYHDLASQIQPLQKATLLAAVVGVVGLPLARALRPVVVRVDGRWGRRLPAVAAGLGAVTAVLVVLVWALRPELDVTHGPGIGLVGNLQNREGVPVDNTRLYSEQSLTWVSWYLGAPTVLLAAAGLGLLVRRAVRGAHAAVLVLGVTGVGALFYLYRLSNTPDQLFGTRRFVPAVFPLFVLAALVAIAALYEALPVVLGPVARRWARLVAVALAAAVVAFPLGTTGPIRILSPHDGLEGAVRSVCRTTGPDASILFPYPSFVANVGEQTLRSWCDVPVSGSARVVTAAEVAQAAQVQTANGRTLWVLDSVPTVLVKLFGADRVEVLGSATYAHDPTLTISRAPDTYTPFTVTFYGVRVPG